MKEINKLEINCSNLWIHFQFVIEFSFIIRGSTNCFNSQWFWYQMCGLFSPHTNNWFSNSGHHLIVLQFHSMLTLPDAITDPRVEGSVAQNCFPTSTASCKSQVVICTSYQPVIKCEFPSLPLIYSHCLWNSGKHLCLLVYSKGYRWTARWRAT